MKISAKTQSELMECIPSRLLDWEYQENSDLIFVKKPKFESKLAISILEPFFSNKYFKVKLDNLGTAVWKNCDGKKTVRQIGEILGNTFGQDIEPIYERLSDFLLQLHRNKFIKIDCPQ